MLQYYEVQKYIFIAFFTEWSPEYSIFLCALLFKSYYIYSFVGSGFVHPCYWAGVNSEPKLQRAGLCLYCVSHRDQTRVLRLGSVHFYLLSHRIAFSSFSWPFYTWPVCSDGSNALTNAFLIIRYMVQSLENQILYTRVGRPLEGHVLTSLIVIARLM